MVEDQCKCDMHKNASTASLITHGFDNECALLMIIGGLMETESSHAQSNWHRPGPTKLNVQQQIANRLQIAAGSRHACQHSCFPVLTCDWRGDFEQDCDVQGSLLRGSTHLPSTLLLQPLLFCLACCFGLQLQHHKEKPYQLPGRSTEEEAQEEEMGLGQPASLIMERLLKSERLWE